MRQPHCFAARRRRRTRRRLVQGQDRPGDWRSEIWRPGYGRLALGPQQLRPDAPGGRHRTRDADQRRRRAVECSREGLHDRTSLRRASRQRAQARLRRTCRRCRQAARSQERRSVPLKPRSEWRYIGKESNSLFDLPDIVTGKAIFGMDATMPGMVYASIEHPPVLGQKIKSYDDKAALKVPGVQKTLTIDTFKPPHLFQPLGGVAVIADNTWAAFKGRKSLKIEWDSSPHSVYNSGAVSQDARSNVAAAGQGCAQRRRRGCRVCQGRQDHRGRVLHSAPGARFHGASRRRRRVSRRQSAGLGADAESAGGAGNDCRRARHQERRRDLPRHAAGRRLRTQVETRSGGGSGRSLEATRQAGKGRLDAAKTTSISTSSTPSPPCT